MTNKTTTKNINNQNCKNYLETDLKKGKLRGVVASG